MNRNLRVIAIGEVLWDVFDDSTRLGGAPLNFAVHASRMKRQVRLVSGVGDDPLGRSALAAIRTLGLETRFVQTVAGFPTGTARVLLGTDGQPSFRIERPAAYDAGEIARSDLDDLTAWAPDWLYYGTLYAHLDQARSTPNNDIANRADQDVGARRGVLWNALKRRELAISDSARRATAPTCRVENGFRRKNAVRWTKGWRLGLY